MNERGRVRHSHVFRRVLIGFLTVCTVLGVATVAFVYWTMAAFRAELLRQFPHDPALLEAVARESTAMNLMLAAIVLVAALNIIAGYLLLARSPVKGPD